MSIETILGRVEDVERQNRDAALASLGNPERSRDRPNGLFQFCEQEFCRDLDGVSPCLCWLPFDGVTCDEGCVQYHSEKCMSANTFE